MLKLAANSPYQGERDAALAAAERLVTRHGMTLDEAAQRAVEDNKAEAAAKERAQTHAEQDAARRFREAEARRAADKSNWEQAWREARARGLDDGPEEKPKGPPPNFTRPRSNRRRNPVTFAKVLLQETALPLDEIASITDLDIYQVAGLKLKLRDAEAA